MTEFFQSDVFMSSMVALLASFLVYLFTRLLCSVQGMGKDEIVKVLKSLEKADRELSLFAAMGKKNILKRDKARKMLLEIRLRLKNSASVLAVYIYEKEDKPKVRSAINKLNALEARCDNIALCYNNCDMEQMEKVIEGIRADLKKVTSILNQSKKEVEEQRKRVI